MEQPARRKSKPDRESARADAERAPLLARLEARIRRRGAMSFAEFMRTALYDPEYGYYAADPSPWGITGDYITVPQVGPALGRCIATFLSEVDRTLGEPDPLMLIEVGSGDGRLLAAVIEALASESPDCWQRLSAWSVEPGPIGREQQQRRLREPGRGLRVVAGLGEVPEAVGAGLLYSNELYDALPVECVRGVEGGVEQLFVDTAEGVLVGRYRDAGEAVMAYLTANAVSLARGQQAEVCLAAEPMLESASARLTAGAVLTIDYGHETTTLYDSARRDGTLLGQRRFRLSDDVLALPGQQDLTAHVDFGNLRRVGRALGWDDGELCSLRVFLLGLGVASTPLATVAETMAVRHLLVSEVGDRHRVLLQVRGLRDGVPEFGRARLGPVKAADDGPC